MSKDDICFIHKLCNNCNIQETCYLFVTSAEGINVFVVADFQAKHLPKWCVGHEIRECTLSQGRCQHLPPATPRDVQTRNLSLCIWITRLIYQTMQTKSMWLLLFSIFFSHVILGLEEVNMLEMTVASALAKLNYISWMNNDCLKLTFHFALRVARFLVR